MVSVIIPSYNYERYLKTRLESIFSQTYRDMEIIFLDDASLDNSVEVGRKLLNQYDIPYRIEVSHRNSGSVFHQWNKGLDLAAGEYIWIAEADDSCRPDFLEKLVPLLEEDEKTGIAYGASAVINSRNRITNKLFYNELYSQIDREKWFHHYNHDGHDEIKDSLFVMNTIPNASAVLFRKSALEKVGGASEEYKLSGDWQTYLNILNHYSISYKAEILNYNRLHNKRVTAHNDCNETYFNESISIAGKLLNEIDIPFQSQEKYLQNLFRQLKHSGNSSIINSVFLSKLRSLFPEELVDEQWISFTKDLIDHEPIQNDLFSRMKRLTPQKVINRCTRQKI